MLAKTRVSLMSLDMPVIFSSLPLRHFPQNTAFLSGARVGASLHTVGLRGARAEPRLLSKALLASSSTSVGWKPNPQRVVLENILPTLSLQGICFQGFRVELHVFEAWAGRLWRLPASRQEGLLGRLRWPGSRKNHLRGSGWWWVLVNKRVGGLCWCECHREGGRWATDAHDGLGSLPIKLPG